MRALVACAGSTAIANRGGASNLARGNSPARNVREEHALAVAFDQEDVGRDTGEVDECGDIEDHHELSSNSARSTKSVAFASDMRHDPSGAWLRSRDVII